MMRWIWLVSIVVLMFSCTMLDPGMHDPDRPRFVASESNVIPAASGVLLVSNGDYVNTYDVLNSSREFRVIESLDYVTLDGVKAVVVDETTSVILSISGAPSGYQFWIWPYMGTVYEVM